MDIPKRLVAINLLGAATYALYFYLQTCDAFLQMLSFFTVVPVAKSILDLLHPPVQIEKGHGYPVGKLFVNFMRYDYGIWSVLLIELIRRIACCGVFTGVLSMALMSAWLLGYVFSASTGVCYTNAKTFRKGAIGFTVHSWLELGVSFLMGSAIILPRGCQP